MYKLRIALVQCPIVDETMEERTEAVSTLVKDAADNGAQMVCLAEFSFRRWFLHHPPREREPSLMPDQLLAKLQNVSVGSRCFIHMVDLEEVEGYLYNSARLLCPDGRTFRHHKLHVPNLPGFRESLWYSPGAAPSPVFETPVGKLGMITCTDVMFPEEARRLGRQGADVILAPRATLATAVERWETMLRANAILSGAYIVSTNRVGQEGTMLFSGESMIITPSGQVEKSAGYQHGYIFGDLDLEQARTAKQRYPVCLEVD